MIYFVFDFSTIRCNWQAMNVLMLSAGDAGGSTDCSRLWIDNKSSELLQNRELLLATSCNVFNQSINQSVSHQSIETHLYSVICRKRIRGVLLIIQSSLFVNIARLLKC